MEHSVIADNRKAFFNYEILATYEAGLVLKGHEAKSIRGGHISLKEAHISFYNEKGGAVPYLIKAHISPYRSAGHLLDYVPDSPRRLLLNKKEINYLVGKTQESGLTVVPLKIYTKNSFLKLEIGLAKGRKRADKREVIKTREVNREIQRRMKGG